MKNFRPEHCCPVWQLKGKNFGCGRQDDIIVERNKTVPICPFLDLVALTCLVGRCVIAELQSFSQSKASFYRHGNQVFDMSWHFKYTHQAITAQFHSLHENVPQVQLLYIISHYWKIEKQHHRLRKFLTWGYSELCHRCLQHFKAWERKQIPHHRAQSHQKPHHSTSSP